MADRRLGGSSRTLGGRRAESAGTEGSSSAAGSAEGRGNGYAYSDGAIYAHSEFGQKIDMMRHNPDVCFEVDHVEDLVNWNSAICWSTANLRPKNRLPRDLSAQQFRTDVSGS
jgi:hypothetical protein